MKKLNKIEIIKDPKIKHGWKDEKVFHKATEYHVRDLKNVANAFMDEMKNRYKNHDYTKQGKYKEDFYNYLNSDGESHDNKWWDLHTKSERHHLNNNVPEDVDFIDVLEYIFDCVSAGLSRSGKVYDVKLDNDVFQKALKNTVDLIIKSSVVVEKEV